MKALIVVLSAPFILLSRIAELINAWGIFSEIKQCLAVIDAFADKVPHQFIDTLTIAEDHRSLIHPGVDPIAMVRAAWHCVVHDRLQGASTIEQQLVRVVLKRYDKNLIRKIHEQILAICISRRRQKEQIASAYLSIAFYGSGCLGLTGLRHHCGPNLIYADRQTIRGMIARLKYP